MKFSKLLQVLLFGLGFMQMGIVGDEGGGADDAAAEAAKVAAEKAATEAAAIAAAEAAKGGKSGPTDEEAKLLKEVMDKKTALKKANDELASAKSVVSQLEELGGLDAIKALVSERKDKEIKELEKKGEWDRLKAQMADEHTKQIGTVSEQIKSLSNDNGSLRATIAELTVGNSFATSTFVKDDLTMPASKVRVLYGAHFEFADGKVAAYDKPAGASERTMLVDAQGEPLTFEAALKKIIDSDPDREQLLKSKIKPGAGSKTDGKGAAPAKKMDAPVGASRISAALAKGGLQK